MIEANLTAGLDRYQANSESNYTFNATRNTGAIDGDHFVTRTPFANSGYFGQVQVGFRDALFVTGGLRAERNDNFGDDYGTAWSPRVGASYVQDFGGVSLKFRGAYGNAIKPPNPVQKEASQGLFQTVLANLQLGPERQRGWDGGVELYFGTRVSFGVTYYDQTAEDLVDIVLLDATGDPPVYQFQNVGEIKNKGWEVEGTLGLGALIVRATYSRPRSTVARLSPTYGGDLRLGDRLLNIPRSIAGATLSYTALSRTTLVLAMTHIGSWLGDDRVGFYEFAFSGAPYRGSGRDYWMEYPSITKFNISVSQQVTPQLTGFVQVDNVGNNTRFELINTNIPLGRVTQLGLRFQQ